MSVWDWVIGGIVSGMFLAIHHLRKGAYWPFRLSACNEVRLLLEKLENLPHELIGPNNGPVGLQYRFDEGVLDVFCGIIQWNDRNFELTLREEAVVRRWWEKNYYAAKARLLAESRQRVFAQIQASLSPVDTRGGLTRVERNDRAS